MSQLTVKPKYKSANQQRHRETKERLETKLVARADRALQQRNDRRAKRLEKKNAKVS